MAKSAPSACPAACAIDVRYLKPTGRVRWGCNPQMYTMSHIASSCDFSLPRRVSIAELYLCTECLPCEDTTCFDCASCAWILEPNRSKLVCLRVNQSSGRLLPFGHSQQIYYLWAAPLSKVVTNATSCLGIPSMTTKYFWTIDAQR